MAHAPATTGLAALVAIVPLFGSGVVLRQSGRADPIRTLTERFQFSSDEVGQVNAGRPVAKVIPSDARDQLAVVGALRIDGDKSRLVGWLRNIAEFRQSAELGVTRVVHEPVTAQAFADLALDPRDLEALRKCRTGSCDLRLPEPAIAQFQRDVRWESPDAPVQAADLLRQTLAAHLQAYFTGGDRALGAYSSQRTPRAAVDDFHELLAGATNMQLLVPELATYLQEFPTGKLQGIEQLYYWSSATDGAVPIISLHHLVVYSRAKGDVVIADKAVYATRCYEAGALVLVVQDAIDGRAFYLLAGARAKSPKLTGLGARALRGQIEKAALEWVDMYLGWIRDSLGRL